MPQAYDPTSSVGRVRLLCNDTNPDDYLFADNEIETFLALEGDVIKLAAAQAIDTIADNEALLSKAIRAQDIQADGPKVADSLRKRAAALRAQVATADDTAEDAGYFEVIQLNGDAEPPELTEWEYYA